MRGESTILFDIKQTRLQKLKELFPELFAENQLDWEKLRAAFADDINFARPDAEKQNMLYELMLKAGYELTRLLQRRGKTTGTSFLRRQRM